MHELIRPALLVAAVLLIPVVPFLVFGVGAEKQIAAWFESSLHPAVAASLVAGVLATDVLLPVPSSLVNTAAGAKLGIVVGTFAAWLGMTAGAWLGYEVSRRWGRPLAMRLAGNEELDRMQRLSKRFGPRILVAVRAVPVLAESSVLLLGATGLARNRFLISVALSNFGIALAYATFGRYARDYDALPVALTASIALPVAALLVVRHFTRNRKEEQHR